MADIFRLERGTSPVLVSVPHAGTQVPEDILLRFTSSARALPDTDWFVDELYDFAPVLGAGMLVAGQSRYVVDLNRPPDDHAMYAGRTTGLVPMETFNGLPVYSDENMPDAGEREQRVVEYWRPYHKALGDELQRIREIHGHAVLFDAHSIPSRVPMLFEGRLPDLNLGSNRGRGAAPELVSRAMDVLTSATQYSSVRDGRFQGGYITRHYGQPGKGVHALQLEMAQRVYMQEISPQLDPDGMQGVRGILMELLTSLIDWRPPVER